jgi:metallophosphoesterase superfamily enzyme
MTKKLDPHNVLAIGDPHEPYTEPGYIEFCKDVKFRYNCGTVIIMGDLVDSYQISLRDLDPNAKSPRDEIIQARENLKAWFKAFPTAKLVLGNHDLRVYKLARKAGIPDVCMRPFKEIWNLPERWEVSNQFIIDNVLYHHGFSATKNAAITSAIYNRMSVVQGHGHTTATIAYSASEIDRIFGMSVGCGFDRKAIAAAYQIGFKEKPIVSCGTVEYGENPHLHMMEL